jgi:predicted small secreted protein
MVLSGLKKLWAWCKIHWKFLLGVSIPIAVGIILRKNNAIEVLKKAEATRRKELDILKKSHEIETKTKAEAQQEHRKKIREILEDHRRTLKIIEKEEKKRIEEIDTAEKATQAIIDKLEE